MAISSATANKSKCTARDLLSSREHSHAQSTSRLHRRFTVSIRRPVTNGLSYSRCHAHDLLQLFVLVPAGARGVDARPVRTRRQVFLPLGQVRIQGKVLCSASASPTSPAPPAQAAMLWLLSAHLISRVIVGLQIGSWNWAGSQCSCGQWVAPAMQFPMSKVISSPDVACALPSRASSCRCCAI